MPTARHGRLRLAVALASTVLLTACGSTGSDDTAPSEPAASPTSSPTPSASATTTGTPAPDPEDAASDDDGPVDSFRTWLAASREPDVDTACAYMTEDLAQRMVDEITAQGAPGITDCASLITMTAGLYAAVGQISEHTVEVRSQTPSEAVLFVTYGGGSDCGSVVLVPGTGHWVLTERSQEEC